MAVKLFVGQVPLAAGEAEIRSVFDQFGPISEVALLRGPDGKSKGCAFVTFNERVHAEKAIELLHDQLPMPPNTQPLQVKIAQNQTVKSASQGQNPPNTRIFIANLPLTAREDEVRRLFEQFGAITDVRLLRDKHTQQPKGAAFVSFDSLASAEEAVGKMHESVMLDGVKAVQVEYAQPLRNPASVLRGTGAAALASGTEVLAALRAASGGPAAAPAGGVAAPDGSAAAAGIVMGRDSPISSAADDDAAASGAVVLASRAVAAEDDGGLIRTFERPPDLGGSNSPSVKLFVGQIPFTASSDEVVQLFTPYGDLHEVVLIADAGGERGHKGAGFVKFWRLEDAQKAIRGLDGTDWAGRKLQVRIAESPGDRVRRGNQDAAHLGLSAAAPGAAAAAVPPQQQLQNMAQMMSMMTQLQQLQAQAAGNPQLGMMLSGMQQTLLQMARQSIQQVQMQQVAPTPALPFSGTGVGAGTGLGGGPARGARHFSSGPVGANLIVHGLADGIDEGGLQGIFAPFGRIVSCTVYRDKETNRSKGFGFVSYDAVHSAEAAIAALDGRAVSGKRLEVRVKQSDVRGRPY
eukprot:TRINITY_DN9423_c0_g1_i1.p1 TRINITY_DN9423_c0_g1~~TRINITY_DN9423_c0_g1_i1.p1  ORF type:complete len:603 (+),score=161.88 TRINITY_DN9423_c0_g1_i1:83-1810(+)